MMLYLRLTKLALIFIALAIAGLVALQVFAQDGERCAAGYAFDANRRECVACNQPCRTGLDGICSRGIQDCSGAEPICNPTTNPSDRLEICNGEDDDCDGHIDEGFDKDDDRYTTCRGDCNDRDPNIHPDAVERCNEKDDNCNGLIDDGFNIGGVCTVGLGICIREGRFECSSSGLESICNAVPGTPSKEICDNLDNDCNGKVDDALGAHSCGIGACKQTIPVCEGGKLTKCVPDKPTAELCGDNIDNDCDGEIDEGFAELGRTCYEGVGACRNAGKMICSDDNLSLICSAQAGEPGAEICGNMMDDDCDGEVDTDTPGRGDSCDNGQLGECRREGKLICDRSKGVLMCSAASVEPQKEICDEKDNNCDGKIDEGVQNACKGCGKLPGEIGTGCMVTGGDECATGTWVCSADKLGTAFCALKAEVSEGKECTSDANPCTRDLCHAGICTHPAVADGLKCDDKNPCTVSDFCIKGKCTGGSMLSCDDQNSCTEDFCDPKSGCIHKKIGTGIINTCGGCEELLAKPGSECVLKDKFGPCKKGQYVCQPDRSFTCVQKVFGQKETCNGIDDDCDNAVDEDLGTISCGIGACRVEIDKCKNGTLTKCVPNDPLPESCTNKQVDDDCDGVIDDIAGVDESCPVAIGTCIVPGARRCVGDAEKPICVPQNARDTEDDDKDGIANYCEHDEDVGEEEKGLVGVKLSEASGLGYGRSKLFDLAQTRAVMIPWKKIYEAAVINSDSPDRAMLLVSGEIGDVSGLAVLRAKDVASGQNLVFRECKAAVGEAPKMLLAIDEMASVIASIDDGYLRYHKIASQIPSPSAGKLECRLYGERLPALAERKVTIGSNDGECSVERIAALSMVRSKPFKIAGAAICKSKDKSIFSRSRTAVIIDIISQTQDGNYSVESIPFARAAGSVGQVKIASLAKADNGIFVSAWIKGENVVGICRQTASGWRCQAKQANDIASPIVFANAQQILEGKTHVAVIDESGRAFDIAIDDEGKMAITKAEKVNGRESVGDALMLPLELGKPRIVLLGRESAISAAKLRRTSDGELHLTTVSGEQYEPESARDDIFPGGKFTFGKPSAMASLPLKRYGGEDVFAAFEVRKGTGTVGEMGFLYWNDNEPPEGTLTNIKFNGNKGQAELKFTDPAGDVLSYRAWIRAGHGGSLDHWIDGFEKGWLRFSVKGDASSVGMWPIEIIVEATDPAGGIARARAVIARDGKVESITESTKKP
ncbi:MAG: putative metal-binding motif-containing protein [Pseudomonadota bacterium]